MVEATITALVLGVIALIALVTVGVLLVALVLVILEYFAGYREYWANMDEINECVAIMKKD